jgi:hypothetical protein
VGRLQRTVMPLLLLAAVAAGCGGQSGTATVSRELGVASDPWQIKDWATAIGAKPTMVMEFESWNRNRTLDSHFVQARADGLQSFMITWEPWVPVDSSLPVEQQAAVQPGYTNTDIAGGALDSYVRGFARSVASAGLTVYIRYAHEMNGNWYPWTHDPTAYIAAWRHIVSVFRQEHATNAKFVYSVNPDLYDPDATFTEATKAYWPGAEYVDFVGSTMINFGGTKQYNVARFADRITLLHTLYSKPAILTEVNTAAQGRVAWLTDLRSWLAQDSSWLKGAVLSQGTSRAKASLGNAVGNLNWDIATDPQTRPVVKAIIEDIRNAKA